MIEAEVKSDETSVGKDFLFTWLAWVFITVAGATLAGLALLPYFYLHDKFNTLALECIATLALGPFLGLTMGVTQWFFFWKRLGIAPKWTISSVLGATIGVFLCLPVVFVFALGGAADAGGVAVIGCILGASLGFGQRYALRPFASRSSGWILASAVGWGVGAYLGIAHVPENYWQITDFILATLVAGQITGFAILVYGFRLGRSKKQVVDGSRKWLDGVLFIALISIINIVFFSLYWDLRAGMVRDRREAQIIEYYRDLGWQPEPADDDTNLRGVFLVDTSFGWSVGDNGLIRTTADGGSTWRNQSSNTLEDLYSVHFYDSKIGWISGDNGTILKTNDGGNNWYGLEIDTQLPIRSVFFVDDSIGWVVGGKKSDQEDPEEPAGEQLIFRTDDGGSTWIEQDSPTDLPLNDVYFFDSLLGWAVGDEGTIISTKDGGSVWSLWQADSDESINAVQFVDADNGWAVGSSFSTGTKANIYRTTNGGMSWQRVLQDLVGSFILHDVHMFAADRGLAIGQIQYYAATGIAPIRTSASVILAIEDGGAEWWVKDAPGRKLTSSSFVNEETGWAVGDFGLMLRTFHE